MSRKMIRKLMAVGLVLANVSICLQGFSCLGPATPWW